MKLKSIKNYKDYFLGPINEKSFIEESIRQGYSKNKSKQLFDKLKSS